MPTAVTHVITSIVLVDLFRKYALKKKNFPLYLIFIAGLAGLLPDIDVPLAWILEYFKFTTLHEFHRSFTHTLVIPFAFLIIAFIIWKLWPKIAHIFFVLSAGWTLHIVLDSIFIGTMAIFYPFSTTLYGLNLIPYDSLSGTFYVGLDAIILVLWLAYEAHAKNIKDYI